MVTKNKKIRAINVANYFISISNKEEKPITNKKLQKLVYYAQVWHIVLHNRKLFSENFEAWVHGPVVPELYEKFKVFEAEPIVIDDSKLKLSFNKKQKDFLQNIWEVYGKLDAEYLEALIHSELPWQEAREGLSSGESSQNKINLKTAKEYYARKLKKNK